MTCAHAPAGQVSQYLVHCPCVKIWPSVCGTRRFKIHFWMLNFKKECTSNNWFDVGHGSGVRLGFKVCDISLSNFFIHFWTVIDLSHVEAMSTFTELFYVHCCKWKLNAAFDVTIQALYLNFFSSDICISFSRPSKM